MWQQFSDAACWLRGQPLEHVAQVRIRIVAVEPRRVHEAHDRRGALARAQTAGEQPVVAPQRNGPDLVLHPVVIDGQLAIVDEARERCPAVQAVVDRLGRGGPVGYLLPLQRQPRVQRIGDLA